MLATALARSMYYASMQKRRPSRTWVRCSTSGAGSLAAHGNTASNCAASRGGTQQQNDSSPVAKAVAIGDGPRVSRGRVEGGGNVSRAAAAPASRSWHRSQVAPQQCTDAALPMSEHQVFSCLQTLNAGTGTTRGHGESTWAPCDSFYKLPAVSLDPIVAHIFSSACSSCWARWELAVGGQCCDWGWTALLNGKRVNRCPMPQASHSL
jgi:hypothetical protein